MIEDFFMDVLKFVLVRKFSNQFKLLFPFVLDYVNEDETMKNRNQTSLKNFKPMINLNHNTVMCFETLIHASAII